MDRTNLAEQTDVIKFNLDIMNKWNNIAPLLKTEYVEKTIVIPGVLQEKYKFDLYGLLLELDVPLHHIYPHIIANGYKSSSDYNGEHTLNILNRNKLESYSELFSKKKIIKR